MNKIITLFAVLVMMIAPVTILADDTDAAEKQTIRWSQNTLYHISGTALSDEDYTEEDQGIWIYEKGGDASMKAYIADPQNNTPGPGIKNVTSGEEYEVYYTSLKYRSDFKYDSVETVKGPYDYAIVVQEKTAIRMKVLEIRDGNRIVESYQTTYYSETDERYEYHYIDDVVLLNHFDDDGFYILDISSYSPNLYVEADIELNVKEFTGSPYLYIGLCIAITALIGFLIAYCGRKPTL